MLKLKNNLSLLGKILGLLWNISPVELIFLLIIIVIQGLIPTFVLLINKSAIDGIISNRDFAQSGAVQIAVSWIASQVLMIILAPINQLLQGNIAERFTALINLKLMEKAESILGLDLLEDPAFHDDIKVLQDGAKNRPLNFVVNLMFSTRDLVTLTGLGVALLSQALWLPFIVLISALPFARATLQLREAGWRALVSRSKDARLMEYYSRIALSPEFAQETRLYGIFGWLRSKYTEIFKRSHNEMRKVRVKEVAKTIPSMSFSLVTIAIVFVWVILSSSQNKFTVGSTILVIQAITQMQSTMVELVESIGLLFERALFFRQYFTFMQARSSVEIKDDPSIITPDNLSRDIVFNDVSFRYPDGRLALEDVNFSIKRNDVVAIVGENGAGKTTLIKLLLRFYDPTSGRVLIDGIDLREIDVNAWRSGTSSVFQNFGRYSFSVRENIGLSNVAILDHSGEIQTAAIGAGFDEIAGSLPDGYNTQLGKEFHGTELSGGQWQKIAIARAILRNSRLLILDEPTAALDPRSEHELFSRFKSLAEGRTTIIITHRLASARFADQILVFKGGKLIENGTHDELLMQGGEYAILWQMQASKYSEDLILDHAK